MIEQSYQFEPLLAVKYGVDEAIFLHNIIYWVNKNEANNRHFYDGRTWTYNSMDAFTKLFPFWSRRQVERIIASCVKQGAIVTGNYNTSGMDRTQWYALSDAWQSIPPNSGMHSTEHVNAFHQTVTPIPDSKPDSKPNESEARHSRSKNNWVKLSDSELDKLSEKYGETATIAAIDYVDESAQMTANKNKWRDWYLVVNKALKNDWGGCAATHKQESGPQKW